MSFYRANAVWEDAEGKWNIGFYDYYEDDTNYGGEYGDEEWDVEYTDQFHYVSTGHETEEEAMNNGGPSGNAGSYNVIPYKGNEERVAALDDKAARLFEHVKNPNSSKAHYFQRTEAEGPSKKLSIDSTLNEYYNLKADAMRYKLNKSVNSPSEKLPALEVKVKDIIKNAKDDDEIDRINKAQNRFTEGLQEMYNAHKRRHRRGSNNGYENGPVLREIKALIEETKPISKNSKNIAPPLRRSSAAGNISSTETKNSSKSLGGTAGKYHINPETGRPNKCNATKRGCPFGGADSHYESKETARKAYEGKMKSESLKIFKK